MKVTVYGSPTCHKCHKVKEFLKEKGIKFEDVNVFADREAAKEMVEVSGQMDIPVTIIDEEIILGYDKDKLEKALKKDG